MTHITPNVAGILATVPDEVTVVAAIKGRTVEQVREASAAGIRVLGTNYIADARRVRESLASSIQCHFIGRMRPHDVRAGTLRLFNMVQSVASMDIASRLDSRAASLGRPMPVLIEVNSGREPQKDGVMPEDVLEMIEQARRLVHLRIEGLMTLGPLSTNPDDYRPAFSETRRLFETIGALEIPGVAMRHLSMGMSSSYRVAIDEGATMVRLGSILFDAPLS